MQTSEIANLIALKLEENASELSTQYTGERRGTRTKFFILDDVLPEALVLQVFNNFPDENYLFRDTFRERKFTYAKLNEIDNPIIENVTDAFQSKKVLRIVSKITKIKDLYADPSLYAGGISRMDKGHFLNPHIDNSHDAHKERYRRLNLLFYVSPNTQESDGGNFELWDDNIKNPVKIRAKFNRLVVMETTKYSWHSVDPIISDIQRCCVSNYFFSVSSPEDYDYYHVTSFLGRPEQNFKRFYGRIDNFLRNSFVKITGYSRGKQLSRNKD